MVAGIAVVMNVIQSSRFKVEAIPFARSRAFRAAHTPHADLVQDKWDESSDHFGLFVDGSLAATFRIVHPADRTLPVCEHLHGLTIEDQDVQIGRFLADSALLKRYSRGSFAFFFLDYFGVYLRLSKHRIYVALLNGGAFSARRFKAIGFTETGARYFDDKYGEELIILVKERDHCIATKSA